MGELKSALLLATTVYRMPGQRTPINTEYLRLHAVPRLAEHRARKTKSTDDGKTARNQQKRVHRHPDLLAWKRWDRQCASLHPRKKLTKIYKIIKSMRSLPLQLHRYHVLAVNCQVSELVIGGELCVHIVNGPVPAQRAPSVTSNCLPVTPFNTMDRHSAYKN